MDEVIGSLNVAESAKVHASSVLRSHFIETKADWRKYGSLVPVGGAMGIPAKLVGEFNSACEDSKKGHHAPFFNEAVTASRQQLEPPSRKLDKRLSVYHALPMEALSDNKRLVEAFQKFHAEGQHHKCIVMLSLNSVSEFETSTATAYFDLGVHLWWVDENFINATPGLCTFSSGSFKPHLEFNHGRLIKHTVKKHEGGHYWLYEENAPYGIIHSYQRYRGRVQQNISCSSSPTMSSPS